MTRVRPRVGVSSCLLGEPVRYDGAQKEEPWLRRVLAQEVELVSICPEVGAGMSVPRPAIQIVDAEGQGLRLQVVGDGADVTAAVAGFAETRLAALAGSLDGYVFKARSPSCGLHDTAHFASAARDARIVRMGAGLWAARVRTHCGPIPLVDESALQDPGSREAFIGRVRAHYEGRKSPKP